MRELKTMRGIKFYERRIEEVKEEIRSKYVLLKYLKSTLKKLKEKKLK